MKEMLQTVSIEEALSLLRAHFRPDPMPSTRMSIRDALGQTLAHDVLSGEDIPAYPRSTMDGYAVRAADTFGASPSNPVYLRLAGTVEMGQVPEEDIGEGVAMIVYTGGILPKGADAVVMIEHTTRWETGEVEIQRQVAPGENHVRAGADARRNEVALSAGTNIRSQEMGYLAALGILDVPVRLRPRVAIVSTGNEIVDADIHPNSGQMRDVNTWTLTSLVEECGGEPLATGIVHDDFDALSAVHRDCLREAQIVVISGGSSKGAHDVVADVIDQSGEPGVFVHGISMKPGKPVIIGVAKGKACFGLPGHPISAMLAFHIFVEPAIDLLLSRNRRRARTIQATLSTSIPSAPGRDDFVRVVIRENEGLLVADPVLGKSGLISLMVNSDGFVHVPAAREGFSPGETVEVKIW
ncbi:MAG: hypothetical protein AUJ92_16715 [Armatimonadetes bacterium CG2_30_59_28]|nr:molybdopterin molybdenumtransferase MoeA [Armatimonadota bacterium]OIO91334.1 MAG: hypothetical protein AUJ92_16715 [Armatimonadetes bacterium CG2_30_59_28]PIU64334.1 MAG: molybdopterin molybdenumtransferase MoeA [Armatimonadetes bacterium CG07_land_8_20_14_0_80_59_28]PIY49076.1 MAG: molybdopterin molybdenumtransferase MoeA [Armatimonadetes bacterium CG_4_10_14_3_um_filter_59_10]